MFGFIYMLLFVGAVQGQDGLCPKKCSCIPGTVRCINVGLTNIPIDDIPRDAIVL